jgi:hypothetical protein
MDLVRDLLDKKLTDRNGREMGRVDRIILHVAAGKPPRVVAVAVGPAVLGSRLNATLGRWVEGILHAFGVDQGAALRITAREIVDIHDHVRVDLASGDSAAGTIERRLRRWVTSIPGS